jgi:hypothetical protein
VGFPLQHYHLGIAGLAFAGFVEGYDFAFQLCSAAMAPIAKRLSADFTD